jgi:hypothetical protein
MARGRKPYRTRVYLASCAKCERWYSCATLEIQAQAKQRGMCMDCENEREGRIKLYMKLCMLHIEDIAKKAGTLPEDQRAIYRVLYKKRLRQYQTAKQEREGVEV